MIVTDAQYAALQALFPGCSVYVGMSGGGATVYLTPPPVALSMTHSPATVKAQEYKPTVFNDDSADPKIKREVDAIEELAIQYGRNYYPGTPWDRLAPDERLGLRARARRYLGL